MGKAINLYTGNRFLHVGILYSWLFLLFFFFQFHFLQEFASNVSNKYVDQAQLAIKVERMGQC